MLIRMPELAKWNWVRSHHRSNSTLLPSLREQAIREPPSSLASFLWEKHDPSGKNTAELRWTSAMWRASPYPGVHTCFLMGQAGQRAESQHWDSPDGRLRWECPHTSRRQSLCETERPPRPLQAWGPCVTKVKTCLSRVLKMGSS